MREAEHPREEGDTHPATTPGPDAAKAYVISGQGQILYRKLTRSLLFRAEFVHHPGGQYPHPEVQASYLWAGIESGGWGLVFLSIHEVFGMHDAPEMVMLTLGFPVALLLGLRRAIVSPGIFAKIIIAFMLAGLGSGCAVIVWMTEVEIGLDKLAPNFSLAVAGLGVVGLSWLAFRSFVPSVGGHVVDQLPTLLLESSVAPDSDDTTTVAPSSLFSAFISHGSPDEPFADKLSTALQLNGISTFLFRKDAVPGQKLHRTMKKGIAEHDRVVLICSRASLDREGVLFEIEEALTREAKMKGESLLIPIRLDRYVFDEWKTEREDIADAVRSRVVADFEGADQDEDKFQAGLRRLLAALRK